MVISLQSSTPDESVKEAQLADPMVAPFCKSKRSWWTTYDEYIQATTLATITPSSWYSSCQGWSSYYKKLESIDGGSYHLQTIISMQQLQLQAEMIREIHVDKLTEQSLEGS